MKKPLVIFMLALLALLMVLQPALAAFTSPNFQIDWLQNMTGAGGLPMASTNYQMDLTFGQTLTGGVTGANASFYGGYWSFLGIPYQLYLPAVRR